MAGDAAADVIEQFAIRLVADMGRKGGGIDGLRHRRPEKDPETQNRQNRERTEKLPHSSILPSAASYGRRTLAQPEQSRKPGACDIAAK
jgi:hypothetical protein